MIRQIKKSVSGREPETRAAGWEARQKTQNHYTPFLNKSSDRTLREQRAQWWLERDFLLIPIQPNSKKIVPGFGIYQDKIGNPERFSQWFGERSLANIAVCATQTSLILDFDDPDLYTFWAGKFPDEARTYTERTPRGGYHVFAHVWGESLKGFMPIKGVELKRVAVVYPSRVDNKQYSRGAGDLLDLDADLVLSPLSQAPRVHRPAPVNIHDPSYLQKIKSAYSCLKLLEDARFELKISGLGRRFVSVLCPFHDDKEPSFWIDTDRNLWGCHACNIRGDVINLYARLKGIDVKAAIREMGEKL